ncbi:hypothetical protein BGX21_000424 [Mortierella sp. AD011]|nr:hypothetical protein BGX21_000424 [Mortierella sp. AD011]
MICQSLRLLGGTEIETIACGRLDEQNIVYWDDIEQVFPGVQYVKNGNLVVDLLRGPDRSRIVPNCIKFYPNVTLDVVLSPVTLVQDVQSQILTDKDIRHVEPPRDLSYLLRTYGAQLEILDFQKTRLDDMALRALAKSIKYGSSLKEVLFPLYRPSHKSEHLDNKSVASIADIVARSALHTFRIDLGQEDTRVRILGAIQWRHLRKLIVVDSDKNQGVGMRAIVESMTRWPGELDLEHFHYGARGTTEDQQRFLRQTVSLIDLRISVIHTKAHEEFKRHRDVKDLVNVDTLFLKSHQEYQETMNIWKQKAHIMRSLIKNDALPKPRDPWRSFRLAEIRAD